jgi:hypothetical protein
MLFLLCQNKPLAKIVQSSHPLQNKYWLLVDSQGKHQCCQPIERFLAANQRSDLSQWSLAGSSGYFGHLEFSIQYFFIKSTLAIVKH